MSNDKLHCEESVLIGRSVWDEPMQVPMSAYLHFSHQMDVRLRRLVACWIYAAAPNARSAMMSPKGERRVKDR
jgi:hypothetical protein